MNFRTNSKIALSVANLFLWDVIDQISNKLFTIIHMVGGALSSEGSQLYSASHFTLRHPGMNLDCMSSRDFFLNNFSEALQVNSRRSAILLWLPPTRKKLKCFTLT
jgi:hypothetical protein